jgi:very-short-patch-repair endonuclease
MSESEPRPHPLRENHKFTSAIWRKAASLLRQGYVQEHHIRTKNGRKYVMDFAHLKRRINVEIDGPNHYLANGALRPVDVVRDRDLTDMGWQVVRIRNL